MTDVRIVSVGFRSQACLNGYRDGFNHQFSAIYDDVFFDLLAKLDAVAATPIGNGVILTAPKVG